MQRRLEQKRQQQVRLQEQKLQGQVRLQVLEPQQLRELVLALLLIYRKQPKQQQQQ